MAKESQNKKHMVHNTRKSSIVEGKKGKGKNNAYVVMKEKPKAPSLKISVKQQVPVNAPVSYSNMLFKDYILNWYDTYKKGSNRLKEQSLQTIYCTITQNIIPLVGNFCLCELTPEVLQKYFVNQLINKKSEKTGRVLSYNTFNKAWIYLNECLTFATNMGHIPKNPIAILQKPKREIITQENNDLRCLSSGELELFVKAVKLSKEEQGKLYQKADILLIFLHTGLRAAELIGMRKKNVDLARRRMLVCENYAYFYDSQEKVTKAKLGTPKTASSTRYVFLDDISYPIVKALYEQGSLSGDAFLLSGTTSPMTYTVLLKLYKRVCRYAGIANPGGLHTLRHTLASTMYANGNDTKMISAILGHSKASITEDIYIHIANEQKNAVMSNMGNVLASSPTGILKNNGVELSEKELTQTKETLEKLAQTMPQEQMITFLSQIVNG